MQGILYGDLVSTVIDKLQPLLHTRPEAYTTDVVVSNAVVAGVARMVTVESAGGGGDINTIDQAFLRVNVYAETDADASDLAGMVRALMTAVGGVVDGQPIGSCSVNAGPNPIENATGKPQFYFLFEVTRRGVNL